MFDDSTVASIVERLWQLNPNGNCVPWHIRNRAIAVARVAQWRYEHPRRTKQIIKKYNNSEKGRASHKVRSGRRRANKLNARGSFTKEEWLNRLVEFDYRCVYCGNKRMKLEPDHFIPLSKDGTNYIGNIVPACRRCNRQKYNRLDWAYQTRMGMIVASVSRGKLGLNG